MNDRENVNVDKTKLDTCGCWERKESLNEHHNRPGLPAIDYRIGTHSTFLRRMLLSLSLNIIKDGPTLARLTTRSPDDPAIAMLDAWATAADVLTFYQERIANEGYLRTATERRSVLELSRAIGYELSPGVAASAYLAFTLEDAPGAPGRATIEERLKVMSIPGQDEKPQTFETVEKIEARKEWNRLKPRLTVQQELIYGATELYLSGVNTRLLPGDAILLVGMEREKLFVSERWDFRILKTVTPFPEKEKNYTIVTWETGLGHDKPPVEPSDKPRVFTFRQRAALFGYNAPDWKGMPDTVKKAYDPSYNKDDSSTWRSDWPDFEIRIGKKLLFNWDNVPGSDWENLKEYLIQTYGTNWIGAVTPVNDGSEINISQEGNLLKIRLNKEKSKATRAYMTISDGRTDVFFAKMDSEKKLKIYEKNKIDLDAVYPRILSGSWVVLVKPGYKELYGAQEVETDALADFMLTAKTTRITPDTVKHLSWFGLRDTVVFAQSEELEMAKRPLTRTIDGKNIELDCQVEGLEKDKKLIISGKRMCVRIADETEGYSLVPSSDFMKPKELKPGEILSIIELPVIVDNRIRWHLMDREGFDGSLDIEPGGKLIINEGMAQIKADDISFVNKDGNIVRLDSGQFYFQDPPFSVAEGRLEWHLTDNEEINDIIVSIESEKIIPVHSEKDDETISEAAFIEYVTTGLERTAITLKESLATIYDRHTVSIYANVALATHGETVYNEVLGNGDGTRPNQRFRLNKNPLTYISSPTPRGIQSTIKVYVNDVEWKETPSLLDLEANSQDFILRNDNDGKTYLTFGDGKKGARLPSGRENIVATYRSGIGPEGEVGANKLSLLQKRPLGVREVTNPIAASGAAPPEKLEDARTNAPFTVLTLERIVSLRDFEDFARAFSGIGKSQAVTFWMGEKKIVHITVAASGGKPVDPRSNLYKNLRKGIDAVRLPVQHVIVESYRPDFFNLEARVKIDPRFINDKVLAAIKSALEKTFSFENRSFGQAATASEINTVIQDVEGVIYVDIEKLYKSTGFSALNQILTASRAFLDDMGNIRSAELLLIKPGGITLTVILNE
ncbi:Uncharacterised protein [uncultured archaeon]|nr:Uncharacterised protein [uncultured archaeon]